MSKLIDLSGKRFGRLNVIKRAENVKGRVAWLCECDCGNNKIVRAIELRNGDTKSCGCIRKEKAANFINIKGKKYGRLKVIKRIGNIGGQASWLCVCECGNESIVRSRDLRDGHTKSCGCYHIEKVTESSKIHGKSRTPLYYVWNMMRQRCQNKNNKDYKHYGARGIKVCSNWNVFQNFEGWALANNYEEGLSIERINNDGNYCPENCKWIPLKDQARNTRKSLKNKKLIQND